MTLWMLVTEDKYELPVIVADTLAELAKKANTTASAICQTMKYYSSRTNNKWQSKAVCRYVKIEVDEGSEWMKLLLTLLIIISILEIMMLMASNDNRKDDEQEQYIKQWNKKNRGDEDGH